MTSGLGRGARIALWWGVIALLGCWTGGGGLAGQERLSGLQAAKARLEAAARGKGVTWPFRDVWLRCSKKRRALELLSGDQVVRTYRVALGFSPIGPKEREGDGRTPEGRYWICTRNERSRFHLFLGISYPGERDARAARARGEIDAATYQRIARVKRPGRPPWKTALGGEVGLHGSGGARSGDWTAGCIGLENDEIDELWVACPLGTPIEILP